MSRSAYERMIAAAVPTIPLDEVARIWTGTTSTGPEVRIVWTPRGYWRRTVSMFVDPYNKWRFHREVGK